jgi:hypothetical protein
VAHNVSLVGSFNAYVERMRNVRDSRDTAEFQRMRDRLGCGDHYCPEPECVRLRHRLGIP